MSDNTKPTKSLRTSSMPDVTKNTLLSPGRKTSQIYLLKSSTSRDSQSAPVTPGYSPLNSAKCSNDSDDVMKSRLVQLLCEKNDIVVSSVSLTNG
jgi:hypothetical protein